MDLSPKATRYVIAAIDHYLQYHDRRLSENGISEDEISDLTNDRQFLIAIKQDIQAASEQRRQTLQATQLHE